MQLEAIEKGAHCSSVAAPSRFLFVNGDLNSTSLSKISTPNLRPVINRHVQRWAFETKGRKKQTSAQQPIKRRLGQKSKQSAPGVESSDDGAPDKAKVDIVRHRKTSKSNSSRYDSSAQNPKVKACIWSEGNYLDPFSSTGISIDPGIFRMLQYFTFTWNPFTCSCGLDTHLCMFPSEVEVAKTKRLPSANIESINNVVQKCLNNKMHMNALLASCSGRMKHVDRQEIPGIATPEFYLAKAIHALRGHLTDTPEVDHEVVRDVFFMFSCEFYTRNFDCAEQYMRILRSMVERLGGFSRLDTYDRRIYWCGDIGLALETGYAPILPAFDNSRIYHTYRPSQSSGLTVGTAFQRYECCTASPLDEIISDMISCTISIQYIIAAELTLDKQRLFEHGADFSHRLMSFDSPPNASIITRQLVECCRQALLLWTFNVMVWFGTTVARNIGTNPRLARPLIAARLRQAICRADEISCSSWDSHHELLFWMVGLGSFVARPGDDELWFEDRFVRVAGLLQIKDSEQMSALFREYFCLEVYEKGGLIRLEKLVAQQRRPEEDQQRDMRMPSMSSSDHSTPASDMRMSSMMTLSDCSTPSSDMRAPSVMTPSTNSIPSSETTPEEDKIYRCYRLEGK
jgi:hypothetical protein